METQSGGRHEWRWAKFAIKITSASLWAWAAATALAFIVCIRNGDHDWIKTVITGWVIISGLFIGGKVLVDALAEAVKKAEIKANIDLKGGIGK
jgi:hypothetical protein